MFCQQASSTTPSKLNSACILDMLRISWGWAVRDETNKVIHKAVILHATVFMFLPVLIMNQM
jgi:hypothetical protein